MNLRSYGPEPYASSSYGKYITVSHRGGFSTLYAHCSRILAASGVSVKEGDAIAEVGETGVATGPHLHFELHQGSQYLNPIYYVSQIGRASGREIVL